MKLSRYLCLVLASLLWASILATLCLATPTNPKFPSTLNFQSLNGIAVPTTEAGWTYEMSRLDMVIASDHLSGLRSRNTDIYLLQYELLHTVLVSDTTEQTNLANYAAANGYDPESAYLHYYDDTTVTYSDGSTVTIKGYGGGTASSLKEARVRNRLWTSERYIYNLKSPLFRKFKGYTYRGIITSGLKPDGIFIDETGTVGGYIPKPSVGGHVIEYGNRTGTDFASEFITDMVGAFADVNEAMGHDGYTGDRVLLPNVAEYIQDLMDVGLSGADGILTEFWIQVHMPRIPYAYDAAKQLADKGKILIFSQGVKDPEEPNPSNYSSAVDRHQMYALTNYWIAKQGNYTYYQQMTPNDLETLDQFWCKARESDIGTPVDALYSVWQTGTDSVGQSYTIYKRAYTKALLLCRPKIGWTYSDYTTQCTPYDLGGTYRLLHWDGTLGPNITKIGLAMGEAVTLVNASGTTPPPSDTTPPTISGVAAGSVTASSATITWTTNEAATGSVDYGTSTTYGSSLSASTSQTSQSVTLTGLGANTTYHYRISALDTAGNRGVSSDYTFTTPAGGGGGGTTSGTYLRHWAMLGSFGDVNNQPGYGVDYISEATVHPSVGDVTAGKTWTDYTAPTDPIDLYSLYSPNEHCTAYLNVYVNSPAQQACQVRIGVDDAAKVYMNGTLIGSDSGYHPADPDTDRFDATLNAGWNQLLIKAVNFSVGWTLYARICDAQGNSMPTLTYQLNNPNTPSSGTPKISVSITADKQTAKVGDLITYTVTYTNTGTGPASSVSVTANVDPHVTFVSASNGGSYDKTANMVRWTIGGVQAGGSGSVTYSAKVQ